MLYISAVIFEEVVCRGSASFFSDDSIKQ